MNLPEKLQDQIEEAGAIVRFHYPWWLRPLMLPGFRSGGITIGKRIYVAAPADHAVRFVRHELAHVHQLQRLGFFAFYWRFLREYFANRLHGLNHLAAYEAISLEQEALAAEADESV